MAKNRRRSSYERFLETSVWARLRRQALAAAQGRCQECGARATEVHHVSYARFGGGELPEDLRAMCHTCHRDHHRHTLPHIWLSTQVAMKHAKTQVGVDIRQRLYESYGERP